MKRTLLTALLLLCSLHGGDAAGTAEPSAPSESSSSEASPSVASPERPPVEVSGRVGLERPIEFDSSERALFSPQSEDLPVKSGDWNGDGVGDLIRAPGHSELGHGVPGEVALGSRGGAFSKQSWAPLPPDFSFLDSISGDFDGNGCSDLAVPVVSGLTGDWYFALSNCGDGFTVQRRTVFPDNARFSEIAAGDFDGDGVDDLIFETDDRAYWVALKNGADLTFSQWLRDFFGNRQNFLIAAPVGLIGLANIRGDERAELVYRSENTARYWTEPLLPEASPEKGFSPWAGLPPNYQWEAGSAADFNGDGYAEILIPGTPVTGWWMAVSNGSTGLERAVHVPFPLGKQFRRVLTGDFNGDGLADLARCDARTGTCVIASARPGPPLAGVHLRLGSGESAITGSEGEYTFRDIRPGHLEISVDAPGHVFAQTKRAVILRETRKHLRVNFLAAPSGAADRADEDGNGATYRLIGEGKGPFVCLGYHDTGDRDSKWQQVGDHCPEGFAFYGAGASGTKKSLPATLILYGSCCRLPSPDILTDEEVLADVRCPDSFVAIGSDQDAECQNCVKRLRCRRINTARYQLGPARPGVQFGTSVSMKRWNDRVDKNDVPIAVRYGIGRVGYSIWEPTTCVGSPIGSLLVAKEHECTGFEFRELQYAGRPDDPPAGTPVKMFPDCEALENIYDPTSGCKRN